VTDYVEKGSRIRHRHRVAFAADRTGRSCRDPNAGPSIPDRVTLATIGTRPFCWAGQRTTTPFYCRHGKYRK
jgi:hypothetical protein